MMVFFINMKKSVELLKVGSLDKYFLTPNGTEFDTEKFFKVFEVRVCGV